MILSTISGLFYGYDCNATTIMSKYPQFHVLRDEIQYQKNMIKLQS